VVGDEYEIWQRDKKRTDGDVRNPLAYWIAKQDRYPRLSQMAMDFLTIQPMLAKCERAFSSAGKTVVATRARLDASMIGICRVLRSSYLAGVLPKTDTEWSPVNVADRKNGENDGGVQELLHRDDSLSTSDINSD
jgi:hypothetical protein